MLRIPHCSNPWVLLGAILSAILWAALLILLPLVINDLPEDFFANPIYLESAMEDSHDLPAVLSRIGRNAFGWFLILVVGPVGLSFIAVLFGFILVDIKGKMKTVRWIVKRHCVWHFLEFVRSKGGKPPLLLPDYTERR